MKSACSAVHDAKFASGCVGALFAVCACGRRQDPSHPFMCQTHPDFLMHRPSKVWWPHPSGSRVSRLQLLIPGRSLKSKKFRQKEG